MLRLALRGFCHINWLLHSVCIYCLWLLLSDETVSISHFSENSTVCLARDFTDTNTSEYFLVSVSVIMNGEEPGQGNEEHIKYVPEPFRKLLFLN